MRSTMSSMRTTSKHGLCMSPTIGVLPRWTQGVPSRNSEQLFDSTQSWSSCCSLAVIAITSAYGRAVVP